MSRKGRQRSGKFYFKNENEVMEELGFTPTKGSGSGWLEKEDGQNDYVIAQLKSTDKQSIRINQLDLEKLEYNAYVSRKLPMFIIQFLNKDTRYVLVAIEDLPEVAKYIETGVAEVEEPIVFIEDDSTICNDEVKRVARHETKLRNKVKSSAEAREQFYKEKQEKWEERKWKK